MRLALIGLKGHQSVVLSGAAKLGDIELVAVADDNKTEVERFKKRTPLAAKAETYTDWRMLLEHTAFDVCCLCDENGVRAEQLIALAKKNAHIVTEKPLTTALDDLDKVRAALAKSKGKLTMLLTMRHEPQYGKLRELIQKGTIGEVCQITTQKSYRLGQRPDWFKERKRLGGTIPYIGIHPIDMMRWVTGLDYTHVAAFHGRIGRSEMKETENHASVLLRCSNGASATARLDYQRPETAASHGDDRIRVVGTEGVAELRWPDTAVSLITASKAAYMVASEPTANLFVEFVQAVRAGKPYRIPAEDCLTITEVVLKARDAADQQKVVELKAPRKP
jgi:predicted dehydrogenase